MNQARARGPNRAGRTSRFRFAVRVKPGARRAGVGGRWDGATEAVLLVAVAAHAVEGKANEAVQRAVAEAFGVRQRDVKIVSGQRGRDKLVENSTPADAAARLGALLGPPPRERSPCRPTRRHGWARRRYPRKAPANTVSAQSTGGTECGSGISHLGTKMPNAQLVSLAFSSLAHSATQGWRVRVVGSRLGGNPE